MVKFIDGIDAFVGSAFYANTDTLYKARLLVGIIICFIASVIFFAPIFAVMPNLPIATFGIYSVFAIPIVAGWSFLLHLLRQGKSYTLCSHLSITSLLFVLYGGIVITGGPLQTEVHPLLIVPAILSFILMGAKHGKRWTAATAALYFSLTTANALGIDFINIPPEETRGLLRVFNWTYAFLISSALIMVYEMINKKMSDEREVEREKLEHIANVAVENSVMMESANTLTESGEELLESTVQQKQSIERLSVTTEELDATAHQNSTLAHEAMVAIKNTDQHLSISRDDLLKLISSMKEVDQSSKAIQKINNVINDIAYQTNLLSLNAMIEASRSNEENGGFKVVALEVKKLAERSSDAAAEINALLTSNVSSVQQGVQLLDKIELRFNEIAEKIGPLVHSVQQVSDASIEQNVAIKQIRLGLVDIDNIVEENKSRAYRSSSAAKKLRENSDALIHLVMSLEDEG